MAEEIVLSLASVGAQKKLYAASERDKDVEQLELSVLREYVSNAERAIEAGLKECHFSFQDTSRLFLIFNEWIIQEKPEELSVFICRKASEMGFLGSINYFMSFYASISIKNKIFSEKKITHTYGGLANFLVSKKERYSLVNSLKQNCALALIACEHGENPDKYVEDIYEKSREFIESGDISFRNKDLNAMEIIKDQSFYERYFKLKKQCIPTGIEDLDKSLLGGLQQGSIVVIAAPTGGGKTALAVNLSKRFLQQDLGVLYFSQEMCENDMHTRFLSAWTGVIPEEYIHLPKEKQEQVDARQNQIKDSKAPLYIQCDHQEITSIIDQSTRLSAQIGVVVIDYIGLVRATIEHNKDRARYMEIKDIMSRLIKYRDKYNKIIIVLAQLTRTAKAKKKGEELLCSDISESSEIENAADVILLVHPREPEKEWCPDTYALLTVDLKKARKGRLKNDITLRFSNNFCEMLYI